MSFIAKNPLSMPEIEKPPSTPQGTRGLFAKDDGWYDIDSSGNVKKIGNDDKFNSLQYYGDVNIISSDASLFNFVTDDNTMTASVAFNGEKNEYDEFVYQGEIVIPYEYVKDGKSYLVTSIANNACYRGVNITSIRIPESVTDIGDEAFCDCFMLSEINIPFGVTSIGFAVFSSCGSLRIITLPDGITSIGASAFDGGVLTDVYFKGTKEQWEAIEIHDWNNNCLLDATIHCEWSDVTKGYVDEKFMEMEEHIDAVEAIANEANVRSEHASIKLDFLETNFSSFASNVSSQMGDIETALDNIIAIQNTLIGGDGE